MNTNPDRSKDTSREDDYRDYEERDLDEGWPYPDLDTAPQKRNEAYGRAPAGLEGDANPGVEVAGAPAIHSEGGPTLSQGIAREAIEDDGLEEAIYERFTQRADLDEDQVTVTVRDGVAELAGRVETSQASAIAEQIAAATPGVTGVRNRLVASAVDSHIPGDTDE